MYRNVRIGGCLDQKMAAGTVFEKASFNEEFTVM